MGTILALGLGFAGAETFAEIDAFAEADTLTGTEAFFTEEDTFAGTGDGLDLGITFPDLAADGFAAGVERRAALLGALRTVGFFAFACFVFAIGIGDAQKKLSANT